MRTFHAAARILVLGSLVLAVFACGATPYAADPDSHVIAQGPLDLNPSPRHVPPADAPFEHGDEDSETDDIPDPLASRDPWLGPSTDVGTTPPLGPPSDGERTAKRRALERPPQRLHG